MVVIDTYHPCGSVTPWDYYGRKHQGEIGNVLRMAGIEHVKLTESHTHNAPVGTGPRGAVRFGDSMMPGVYRIAVGKSQVTKAREALATHKREINDWLARKCKMPVACRS